MTKLLRMAKLAAIALPVFGAALMLDGRAEPGRSGFGLGICQAEARVGRPATATSVAGVARRSARRTVRRRTYY